MESLSCMGVPVRDDPPMVQTTTNKRTYDHRIRQAICASGDPNLFPALGIPRWTALSWIRRDFRRRAPSPPPPGPPWSYPAPAGWPHATPGSSSPKVVTDSGVENVNGAVDELMATSVLTRVLALVEVSFSNSKIEAFWRSLRHGWLYLNDLDTIGTLERLVRFYVEEHNTTPHSSFGGPSPDERYRGKGDEVPGTGPGSSWGGLQLGIRWHGCIPAESRLYFIKHEAPMCGVWIEKRTCCNQ